MSGNTAEMRHNNMKNLHWKTAGLLLLGSAMLGPLSAAIRLEIQPGTAKPGQPVQITIRAAPAAASRFQLTEAYFIDRLEVLPGFAYDPEKKKSLLAIGVSNALAGTNGATHTFQLDTRNWPPGVSHLILQALDSSGKIVDDGPFALKVAGPRDHLAVTVAPSILLGPGTHFGRFLKLRDGTLLSSEQISRDGGRTWQKSGGRFGEGAEPLRNGSVVGLAFECQRTTGQAGWYHTDRFFSQDGRAFAKDRAELCVPEAKSAFSHTMRPGPLFMRSILERTNGTLVAYMAGWFKSDTAISPYGREPHGRERPYSRAYVCESDDSGRTWRYLSTIGYEPIGSEGYNEGSMRCLPDGSWLVVMRTGSPADANCQDSPLMWSASRDEGRTWSKPARTGLKGLYPSLAVLSDGLVVMSYGRPGARLAFNTDRGRTWTDATPVDAAVFSGYTDVVEIAPGELLVGFGTRGYLDPATGARTDGLRLARVRYRENHEVRIQ